jgi:hypothetical protein
MVQLGTFLGDSSEYGRVLIKLAQTQDRMAIEQTQLASNLKMTFITTIDSNVADYVDYQKSLEKLESRRLDFDAKLNKAQKAKREKLDMEEEIRTAQEKYEEALSNTSDAMIKVHSSDEEQLNSLKEMIELYASYHEKCLCALQELQSALQGNDFSKSMESVRNSVMESSINSPSRLKASSRIMSGRSSVQNLSNRNSIHSISSSRDSFHNAPHKNNMTSSRDSLHNVMKPTVLSQISPAPQFDVVKASQQILAGPANTDSQRHAINRNSPSEVETRRKIVVAIYDFEAEGPNELTSNVI